jgi:flagellar biogenesis protein FliO
VFDSQLYDYLKTMLALVAILALAYLVIRYWLPRMTGIQTSASGPIQVISRFALEPKKGLYIVKAGSEYMLLGTSESGIQYLTALKAEDIEALAAKAELTPSAGVPFQKILERWRTPRA